jgi:hypothetical protein
MKEFLSRHFPHSSLVMLCCLCAAVVLSSCSKKPSKAIVGKWHVQGQTAVVEFKKDGTLTNTDHGRTDTGTYKFTDGSHMQVEINVPAGNSGSNMTVTVSCAVTVRGELVDLLMTVPSEPKAGPQTVHLRRIK